MFESEKKLEESKLWLTLSQDDTQEVRIPPQPQDGRLPSLRPRDHALLLGKAETYPT